MEQAQLFNDEKANRNDKISLGNGLFLKIGEDDPQRVTLYRYDLLIKTANLADRVEKRLFVVEAVETGALRYRLANALQMNRQTIHNYLEIKKRFGIEGLIHGYSVSDTKSKRKQRKLHAEKRMTGNKAEILAEIRKTAREERETKQRQIDFTFGDKGEAEVVPASEQPFNEKHDWEFSRYAGVFSYLIALIVKWKWLRLTMGYFGNKYTIFLVFLLMAARNIRSIEQLKNIRSREAGAVLGIGRIGSIPRIWEWFYNAAQKKISRHLLWDYFRYQIRTGLVGIWLWFTDGHLLPYTGRAKVRHAYNTQRQRPFPGQTNMVTCDVSGRVVYFEIQEGKGDLRSHIIDLSMKWREELPHPVMMIFDREGTGDDFFIKLVYKGAPFVTWEKNADAAKLSVLDDKLFAKELEVNGKIYGYFEEEKVVGADPRKNKDGVTLRRINIWNKTSNRRTCGLAWSGSNEISAKDFVYAILNRWGASENTFKHIKDRHPYHYHPGFKLAESERQDIANPAVKEKEKEIKRAKNELAKLYKKLSKTKDAVKKNGKPRQNSIREKVKREIADKERLLAEVMEFKKGLPERVDVSSLEGYDTFKCIDNEGKNLFDFVTTSVWNARKQMVDWLRPFFNVENELVDLFYAITECHGWIKSNEKEVIVRLEPLQQPKRRLAQEQLCRKLTSLGAQTPNGKWLIIEVGEAPV